MFLMIHESGDVVKLQEVTDDDLRAASDGVVTIINIGDNPYPTKYVEGVWVDVPG